MKEIVIAGGSVAAVSAATELRSRGFEGHIRVLDKDVRAPYRRPAVSKTILTGTATPGDIAQQESEDLRVERMVGATITALDASTRTIEVLQNRTSIKLRYDGLVIATGCRARDLPLHDRLDGVFALRSVDDALQLRDALSTAERLLIIGAGFIGLEVAAAARSMGLPVSVIEAAPSPLVRAVGSTAGAFIAEAHTADGVELLTETSVSELVGHKRVEVAALSDGRRIDTDVVVVAVGAIPEVAWLHSSGLDISSGIRCDATCAVAGATNMVAAGDVASWHNPLYDRRMRVEHWTHALEQGAFAARRLLGDSPVEGFASAPYFWSDQGALRIQSVGAIDPHDEEITVMRSDGSLLVAFAHLGRLVAVVGVNAGAAVARARAHVLESRTIAAYLELFS